MRRFGPIIIGIALLLASFEAMGAENLWDIYQIAEKSDPQTRAAAADRAATLEVLPQSRAILLPDIGVTGSLDRRRFDDLLADNNSISFSTDQFYSLALTQPIYRRDRFIQLRQADSRILQAEAEYTAIEQGLMVRTAEAYFAVLGALDDLEFTQAEKNAIGEQLEQSKQRFDVGLIAITDVHEAQARYDLSVSEEIKASNLLENAYEALREITGTMHKDLQLLGADLPLIAPDPASPEQWVQTALGQNYAFIAAKAAAETAHQEIERQRSGHYPTLDFTADQSYRDLSFGGTFGQERSDTSIGLQLSLPIYQGGRVVSQTRESHALFEGAQERVEQQRRATERQMRDTYRGVMTDIALVRALAQALVSTNTALDAAQVGFDVGTRTIVDVLNAQREVFRAKRDYARSRYDYLLNTLRMKQAAGILSDNDIKGVSSYLRSVPEPPKSSFLRSKPKDTLGMNPPYEALPVALKKPDPAQARPFTVAYQAAPVQLEQIARTYPPNGNRSTRTRCGSVV